MTTQYDQQLQTINNVQRGADQKHCFSCANIIHFTAEQCPSCGAKQPSTSSVPTLIALHNQASLPHHIYCRGCGSSIHENALTCPKCGAPQSVTNLYANHKSRITAAVCALFLGGIGVHKFYLGQNGLGFIYLLFCWTFIPGIIGLIEGIVYMSMSDEDFARKY